MYKIPAWAGILMIGALLAASAVSLRIALGDVELRRQTVTGMEKAIALSPDNSEYYARLAWLLSNTDPRGSKEALQRAVALNPWDAPSWIELGLRAEAEGDSSTAEACLLRAADIDLKFLPRWSLANYYFRRHDTVNFWRWMKRAAPMAYGDSQPMFLLCGSVEEDGRLMERLNIVNPDMHARYLSYLLTQKRVDLAGLAVDQLLRDNREADVSLLLTACERLLDAGQADQAADVWSRLATSGRLLPIADQQTDQKVVNRDFSSPPSSRGLDWRTPQIEGTAISREDEQGGLQMTFSGREPEECQPLTQFIPLRARTRYQLQFAYRTHWTPGGGGLRWRIVAQPGATLAETQDLASEPGADGSLQFETPAACKLVRLVLHYRRPPGTTRLEGFIVLRRVTLKPAAQSPGDGARVSR